VQGFHYPFPSVAHVEKTGTGYREIPVMWNPTALTRNDSQHQERRRWWRPSFLRAPE
jgi:hypothetical protein